MSRVLYTGLKEVTEAVQLSTYVGKKAVQMFQITAHDGGMFVQFTAQEAQEMAEVILKELEKSLPMPGDDILINVQHKNGESYIQDCPLSIIRAITSVVKIPVDF